MVVQVFWLRETRLALINLCLVGINLCSVGINYCSVGITYCSVGINLCSVGINRVGMPAGPCTCVSKQYIVVSSA